MSKRNSRKNLALIGLATVPVLPMVWSTLPARADDTYLWTGSNDTWTQSTGWYRTADSLPYNDPPDGSPTQAVVGHDGGVYILGNSNETARLNFNYSLGMSELDVDSNDTVSQVTSSNMASAIENIGIGGTGTYSQSSATNKVTNFLALGNGSGGSGVGYYNLSGTGTLTANTGTPGSAANVFVGYSDSGYMDQEGGTASITGNLYLADYSSTAGQYELNYGTPSDTGSLTVTGTENVGLYGNGYMYQGNGTNQVGSLIIAANPGSTGYYELDSGTLSATGVTLNTGGTYDQFGGTLKFGSFTQAGGSAFFSTGVNVGNETYNLQSGTLTAIGAISLSSGGTFHQSGGSLSFLTFNQTGGTANFDTGLTSGVSYSLSGGSLTASSISGPVLSWTGGSLTLTGQTFNVSGSATDPTYGGFDYGAALTLNSGMTLDANSNWEFIFGSGTSITQNAGSTNNTPNLYMGSTGTGTAVAATQYNLNGGTLTVSGSAILSISGGYAGPLAAVFTQAGGTASFGTLAVGEDGAGTYSLSAGTATVTGALSLYTGGVLHQSGGTLTFPVLNETGGSANFDNGLNLTSSTVNLSGGSLTAASITGSPSHLNWTGGTLGLTSQYFDVTNTTDPANNGFIYGSSLTLNSGMGLNLSNAVYLFGSGSSLTQNAGSSVSTLILLAGSTGTGASPDTYTMSGGTLNVSLVADIGFINQYTGPGAANFTQSGGTSSFNQLNVGHSSPNNGPGAFTLSAGTMSVNQLNLNSGSTFHQSGGSLTFSAFNQSGGTSNFDTGVNLSSSTISLSGGSMTTSSITTSGTPNLNWTGGSLTLTNQRLDFGAPGTDGTYRSIIFGNSLTLNSGMSLSVTKSTLWEWMFGDGSTITQNTGSSNQTPALYMGATPGTASPDQYNMTGGTLVATNSLDVGYATGYPTTGTGAAVFTQTGGNVSTASLNVGLSGPGTYSLSAGTLDALGSISVYSGGTFHQSGGVVIFPAFNQSGGTVNFDNGLNLLSSTYALSGGSLTTPTITSSTVGPSNLVWTGGSLALTEQQFNLAASPDNINHGFIYANSLTLNSGMGLTVSNAPEILYGNGSSITQNANSSNYANELVVSSTGTTPGQYSLNAGSLTTKSDAYVGEVTIYGGPGAGNFIQSNGTVNVGGTLFLGIGGASGQYQLNGQGTLMVGSKIDIRSSASLTMGTDAGTITTTTLSNQGTVQMNGGSLSVGNTSNSGSYTQTGGMSTLGAVSGGGDFTIGIGSSGNPYALASVTSLSQGATTVGNGGILDVHANSNFDNTVSSLSITGTGQLDLANNHLFIQYGSGPDPIASIIGLLATGYSGGYWLGQGGIDSSAAAGNPGYALGYADGADAQHLATGLTSGEIEIKYTLLGDADLNGIVNGIDFGILAANFNKGVTGWDEGDFDYNNIVNGIDFGDLAANFNKGAAGTAVGGSALSDPALVAFAQANGLMADVPEPAALGLLGVSAAGLISRRRRSLLKPVRE